MSAVIVPLENFRWQGTTYAIEDGVSISRTDFESFKSLHKNIGTIEGVASPDSLHVIQQKFLEHAALQCGVCTPGLIVATKSLLEENPEPTEEEARYWLAGNLCRCTGYDKIIRAVMDAAAEIRGAA